MNIIIELVTLLSALAIVLSCLGALLGYKRYELSLRVAAIAVVGLWAALRVAQVLGAWSDIFAWGDRIGIVGVALWVAHLWRIGHHANRKDKPHMRRAADWADVEAELHHHGGKR